jgi:hypothetical protein
MITDEEDNVQARVVSSEVTWRNPLTLVRAHLRVKERSSPYYGWAEQARRIRARRAIWNANQCWAV